MIELNKLKALNFSEQITFGYLTCERLFPNYTFFSNNYQFGDPNVLRECIDFVYSEIFTLNPATHIMESLEANLESNIPDPGEFETELASSALDACTSTIESLKFLNDKKFTRIADISTFALDSVEMYIQDKESFDVMNDRYYKEKIQAHYLMKKEIAIQNGIIKFLTINGATNNEDVQTLLNLQENEMKGSLDL